MKTTLRVASALSLAWMLAGCPSTTATDDAGATPDTGGPSSDAFASGVDTGLPTPDAPRSGAVTYYGDVRPVLAQHCNSCHGEAGIAPFTIATFEEARTIGSRLVDVTASRQMPPFLADNSGACNTYRDARWLTDAELAVFADWVAGGMLEGDPTTPPPVIEPLPTLTGDVRTLDIGVDFEPNRATSDDYRCFVVDAPSGGSVTGYQVRPGNVQTVHHVIVYEPSSDAAAAEIRRQDAAEAGPGYTCYGGAGADAFPVVLWAPGGGATSFPRGTGVEVSPTRPMVIQIHYNTLGGSGTDRTRVDLQYASASVIPAYIAPIVNSSFRLPPRMASVTSSDVTQLDGLPVSSVRVYGSFPHMHTLGRTLQVDLMRASGAEECMINVPNWDFNWQLAYWYETPIRVNSADAVRITCNWDTTERTDAVTWGEGTQDEMCLNFFYVSL